MPHHRSQRFQIAHYNGLRLKDRIYSVWDVIPTDEISGNSGLVVLTRLTACVAMCVCAHVEADLNEDVLRPHFDTHNLAFKVGASAHFIRVEGQLLEP